MEIVLRTQTPEGVEVVLPALVYAKVREEHAAVADLGLMTARSASPTSAARIRDGPANASSAAKVLCGCWRWWTSAACLRSSSRSSLPNAHPSDMPTAAVHITATDLLLTGFMSQPVTCSTFPPPETTSTPPPSRHPKATRSASTRTAASRTSPRSTPAGCLEEHGELVATLRDGRQLRIDHDAAHALLD